MINESKVSKVLKVPKEPKTSKVPQIIDHNDVLPNPTKPKSKFKNNVTKFNNKPNFKKIDYRAWQKSLIHQFGKSLPDSQLRLKTPLSNGKHGPSDSSNNPFDEIFKHIHILDSIQHETNSWFDLRTAPFQQLKPVPRPIPGDKKSQPISDVMWWRCGEYLKSFDKTPSLVILLILKINLK